MSSWGGTSKSGNIYRYYRCPQKEPCPQVQIVKKEVLEQAITQAFARMLSTESNFDLLVDKILETFNSKLYDTTELKIAEKELQQTEKAINNLIAAVENGFYSESTNERLKELESRKSDLNATIAKERVKEVKPLERKEVEKYLSYAIAQPSQTVIDLLVRKVIIKDNTAEVYLKYCNDEPPRGDTTHKAKIPERNLSEQGFLFISYTYCYIMRPKERKIKFSTPQQVEPSDFIIHVMI
jgi:hypothetical protein